MTQYISTSLIRTCLSFIIVRCGKDNCSVICSPMPIMERLFLSLFVLCTISFVFCFKNYGLGNILINSGNVNAQYSISRANADRSLHMAISSASLVRKNKFKEIEILKKNISESGGEDAITKFLTTGERPYGSNQPVPFRNSILNK